MDIATFCGFDLIEMDIKAKTKDQLLEEMIDLAARSDKLMDRDKALQAIREREHVVTTGVGYKVALPHAKTDAVKGLMIAFGKSKKGVNYDALDNQKVHIIFLVLGPSGAVSNHLSVLAKLSLLLRDHKSIDELMNFVFPHEILNFLKRSP